MPGTTEQLGPTPSFEQALSVYRLIVDEVHQVKEWEIKFITWTIAASGAAFALHPTAGAWLSVVLICSATIIGLYVVRDAERALSRARKRKDDLRERCPDIQALLPSDGGDRNEDRQRWPVYVVPLVTAAVLVSYIVFSNQAPTTAPRTVVAGHADAQSIVTDGEACALFARHELQQVTDLWETRWAIRVVCLAGTPASQGRIVVTVTQANGQPIPTPEHRENVKKLLQSAVDALVARDSWRTRYPLATVTVM